MWMLRFHLHIFYATPDFLLERCKTLSVTAMHVPQTKKPMRKTSAFLVESSARITNYLQRSIPEMPVLNELPCLLHQRVAKRVGRSIFY